MELSMPEVFNELVKLSNQMTADLSLKDTTYHPYFPARLKSPENIQFIQNDLQAEPFGKRFLSAFWYF